MMKKTVTKRTLQDSSGKNDDLAYWLSKTPEKRVAAVEDLRRQYCGSSARLHRVARVVKRAQR